MISENKDSLNSLKERFATVSDLQTARLALNWDRQTQMPPGGVAGRGEQLATLSHLAHELISAPETGRLLKELSGNHLPTRDTALVRVAGREHRRATKLPVELIEELARVRAVAESVWRRARKNDDWNLFRPHLERTLDLKRRMAGRLGYEDHPYDALLDLYEPGATTAGLRRMFEEIEAGISPLLKTITARQDDGRDDPLHGDFDEERQRAFGTDVITRFGYDWDRGRLDEAVHPFCVGLEPGDVRITTRYDPRYLARSLFATLHEAGHALYEQSVDPALSRTPLAGGASLGVHESQSRLWENLVGRSEAFWTSFYPRLQEMFPDALGDADLRDFYRAVNTVRPSEIRTEADELTYDLHVLMRFHLEVDLLEGNLTVADLPDAWNEKTRQHLNLTPENDARGVLQDVHWAAGFIGYFPTYTIGNTLSVQLFEAAVREHPEIPSDIGRGKFSTLRGWLRENVHQPGKSQEPAELVERATGRPPETAPYVRYLTGKYTRLYDL